MTVRVALVGPSPESRGGVAATLRLLCEAMPVGEFEPISVATYRDGSDIVKTGAALTGLWQLAALCSMRRVRLVHVHVSGGSSLARKAAAIAVARACGIPVVTHLHGGAALHKPADALRSRVHARVLRWTLEHADTVIVLSAWWEGYVESRARPRRLEVIPNAAQLEGVGGPADRRGTVAFIGHLYRDKGVFELIDAFAQLHARRPELRLYVAGEGSERRRLKVRIRDLGIEDAVELPGWIGPEAKARLLHSTGCFVLPSYHEGLPLALLEAMLAGAPVVATAVGAVPDVVEHGVHGLLVPPRNVAALRSAMERVLDEPDLAERLASAAQQRIRSAHAPDVVAERVARVYREVLAAR